MSKLIYIEDPNKDKFIDFIDKIKDKLDNYFSFYVSLKNPTLKKMRKDIHGNWTWPKNYIYVVLFGKIMRLINDKLDISNANEFRDLFEQILINNINNIRYDMLIFAIENRYVIKYYETNGLFYLFDKIHPDKLLFEKEMRNEAFYIYDKLIKDGL